MTKARAYEYARNASLNSNFGCHALGAVAIYGGKVLAFGWNSLKTHPAQAHYNSLERGFDGYYYRSTIHAEMMVINKIKYLDINFSKVKIFVWRGKNGPRISKPCAACERALRDLGIKHIFYTGNDSYIEETYN
jgi:deoxycytidylate deaminase